MAETDERQYWVWVAAPDRYGTEDGREHPDLDPTNGGTRWSCHRDTRAGDLAVLYRSRQAKDIAYRLRAVGDAYQLAADERAASGLTYACDVVVLDRFARPIPLADLKADPVIAGWPALRSSFARSAAPVPREVWARLMEMAEVSSELEAESNGAGAAVQAEVATPAATPVDGPSRHPATAPTAAPEPPAPVRGPAGGRSPREVVVVALAAVVAAVLVAAVVRGVRRRH